MLTKIEFDFNTDAKVGAIFLTYSDSKLKTALNVKYANTGHFIFALTPPNVALRSKLAMLVRALNNMEPRNASN